MSREFVQSSDCGLDFGHDDLVLLDLLIKRAARDTEALGSFLHAAALLVEDPLDVLFFEFDEREASIEKWRSHLRMAVEVQVFEGDVFLVTQ